MTTNALLIYFGVALASVASVFFVLGIRRVRRRFARDPGSIVEAPEHDPAALGARRADFLCGAMLLMVALIAAGIGIERGGPAVGEVDGNTGGAVILISLATLVCVVVCLVARHSTLARVNQNPDTQFGGPGG